MKKQIVIFAFLLIAVPCYAEEIVCFNMDSDPGWTAEGQWEFGIPQGGGGPESYDPTSGYTGSNVYGYNLAGNYGNDMPEYKLTTSAIDCKLAENVTLGFYRWLGVEGSSFDHAKVQVSNNGTDWTNVWSNGTGDLADSSWVYCEYDISAVADGEETVYIRWCMGPTDISNVYAGWNIDDVCLEGDLLDPLFISTTDAFFSTGPEGGPFSPACKSYTLSNEGASDVNWTAEATESWLQIAPDSGILAADSNVVVNVCIIADANLLSEGVYTDTVSFRNLDSDFAYLIDVMLHIYPTGALVVPLQYPTIRSAIDASSNGDTILVLDGTYTGGGNRSINFNGKAITVKSQNGPDSCIINCGNNSTGFYFYSGEDSNSVLDGFTIYRGYSVTGGGIYCSDSSPYIVNCILKNNLAIASEYNTGRGGGMYNCNNSNPTLVNCEFISNRADVGSYMERRSYGGGMYNTGSNPTLINCMFRENRSVGSYDMVSTFPGYGGGMYNSGSKPVLINCAFFENYVVDNSSGGGIHNSSSKTTITNCIFWGNYGDSGTTQAAQITGSGITINYSCVQGWSGSFGGTGNIGDNPLFVTGPLGDYYLGQIAAGQSADSPCVGTGSDTAVNLGLNFDTTRTDQVPDEGIVDMGYHYGVVYPPLEPKDADINGDLKVDMFDYAILASQWQQEPCVPSADIAPEGGDEIVDMNDLSFLVENWLWYVDANEALISYWEFDEGQGSIAYDSAGGNNGIVYGAVRTTGKINGALEFDGYGDYVDCGSHPSLDVTELTWALWIKRAETTYTDERALISNEGGGQNTQGTYALQIDTGEDYQDKIQFLRHGDHVELSPLSNTAIQDMDWHHIAVTRDDSSIVVIYIDGLQDAFGYCAERTAFTKTVIGTGRTGYSDFYGKIDDVRIYNTALSAEHIWLLYQDGL